MGAWTEIALKRRSRPPCPKCGGFLWRFGRARDRQKYRCRDCQAWVWEGQDERSQTREKWRKLQQFDRPAGNAKTLFEVLVRNAGEQSAEWQMFEDYVRQSEAARRLGVTRQRINQMKAEGRFQTLEAFGAEWIILSSFQPS